nr:hypothetical protein [Prolixibacteraceae bacterium]
MKKYGVLSVLGWMLFVFQGFAQVEIMPNLVLTQEFASDKDIWPTFTKGVVHYEAQIMYIYGE